MKKDFIYDIDLDLGVLHKTHYQITEGRSLGRKQGQTTYAFAQLIGYLQVLQDETIVVVLRSVEARNDFMQRFTDICAQNRRNDDNLRFTNDRKNELFFFMKNNTVQFMFYEAFINGMRGRRIYTRPIIDLDADQEYKSQAILRSIFIPS